MKSTKRQRLPAAALAALALALALFSLGFSGCYYYEEACYPSHRSYGHGYGHGYGYGHQYAPKYQYGGYHGHRGYGGYGGGYNSYCY